MNISDFSLYLLDSPELLAIGENGVGTLLRAVLYSDTYQTEGFIPFPYLREEKAALLVATGLLTPTAGGYVLSCKRGSSGFSSVSLPSVESGESARGKFSGKPSGSRSTSAERMRKLRAKKKQKESTVTGDASPVTPRHSAVTCDTVTTFHVSPNFLTDFQISKCSQGFTMGKQMTLPGVTVPSLPVTGDEALAHTPARKSISVSNTNTVSNSISENSNSEVLTGAKDPWSKVEGKHQSKDTDCCPVKGPTVDVLPMGATPMAPEVETGSNEAYKSSADTGPATMNDGGKNRHLNFLHRLSDMMPGRFPKYDKSDLLDRHHARLAAVLKKNKSVVDWTLLCAWVMAGGLDWWTSLGLSWITSAHVWDHMVQAKDWAARGKPEFKKKSVQRQSLPVSSDPTEPQSDEWKFVGKVKS